MNFRYVNRIAIRVMLSVSIGISFAASASVVIDHTRLIYPSKDSEITARVSNVGKEPALIQVWIDNGDPNADPSFINVPFTLLPPVARINPDKSQTIRILYTEGNLPQDRESLFWLNILDIPPKIKDEQRKNWLQFAVRNRIKLFFRPDGIGGTSMDAVKRVGWRVKREPKTGGRILEITNPTPFFETFLDVAISNENNANANSRSVCGQATMVAPFSTATCALSGEVDWSLPLAVNYTLVNDYGGYPTGHAVVEKNRQDNLD